MATWTASTRLRRAAAAVRTFAFTLMNIPMMPEAIEHAAPTRNAIAGPDPELRPEGAGVRDVRCLERRDEDREPDRRDQGEDRDGRVLAPDERDGSLEDGRRDVLHGLRAGVAPEDVPGKVQRKPDRDQAGGQDDKLERA